MLLLSLDSDSMAFHLSRSLKVCDLHGRLRKTISIFIVRNRQHDKCETTDMKFYLYSGLICFTILLTAFVTRLSSEHKTLEIGMAAPDFELKGVDGKTYNLASFEKAKVLVVIFTCNHCPTAQAYEDRIIRLASDYGGKNVAVVAIMPNDPACLRLDELDFSDLGDSYEEMKIRAREKNFNFPYLYDGETEAASNSYGPVATPHVF